MKKIKILSLIIIFILQLLLINSANAVECHPAYNGNWTVTNNCDWPDGKKVYGNIYVGAYTVTMGSNDDMGIDLSSKKITFTTGKINLATTAKIENHVSTRYYVSVSYSTSPVKKACPSGMYAFNTSSAPNQNGTTGYLNITSNPNPGPYTYSNANFRLVNPSGTFYCGTKGS